jgi:hypothetical protein
MSEISDAEAEELENMEQSINQLLVDEGLIADDFEKDWEPLIAETAKKFIAFYNRKS